MALSIDQANTISQKYYDKGCRQQVYEDDPFLTKLKKNNSVKTGGGTQIQWGIRYRKYSRANAVGAHQQVVFEQKETRTGAVLDWTQYNVDTMINWQQRIQNSGKEQIINLLADLAEELRQDMMDRFATDLYTTNPNGLGFVSLDTIVDSADTYAGIAVADAASWAGVEDSTTTELVLYGSNSLSYQINQATIGKFTPDIHVTTRDLASKFESLIEPQKRYQDKSMADAGFKNVTFHGVPVMGNPFVPTGYWYGLCSRVFKLRVHSDWNFEVSPWTSLFQAGFPRAMGKVMSWAGNLQCDMRKCNLKFSALDYTLG